MGVNDVNFPTNVRSDEEAIQYLALMVQALKTNAYVTKSGAGPFTLTATEMVGGVVEFSGSAAAVTVNTALAAAIIARMQALDANAGVGSTAIFVIVNDETSSGVITLTSGDGGNVTIIGPTVAIASANKFQIKILTLTTVSFTKIG